MADFEIIGTLTVDDRGNAVLKTAEGNLRSVTTAAGGASSAFAKMSDVTNANATAMQRIADRIIGLQAQYNMLGAKIQVEIDKQIADREAGARSASEMEVRAQKIAGMQAKFESLGSQIGLLQAKQAALAASSQQTANAETQMGDAADRAAKGEKAISDESGRAQSSLSGLSSVANQATQSFSGMGMAMQVAIGNLLSTGIEKFAGAVAGGFGAIKSTFTGTIADAMDAEKAAANLEATIKSTGATARGITAEGLMAYSTQLSRSTEFTEEQITSAQAMLLTFTSIGGTVLPDATEAVANMAAKFGGMESASIQVGKALNDPIEGVSALRRVGVMMTDQQEQQIKSFMELGDIAGAQKVILAELETEFGGLAVAMGQTAAGEATRLKNNIGELGESFGANFLPAISSVLEKLNQFATSDAVTSFVSEFGADIGDLATQAAGQFDAMASSALSWGENIVIQLANGIASGVSAVISALTSVGDIIAGYLMPGSPPALLPQLNAWGSAALGEYMKGWAAGDFSAFDQVAGTIEGLIRSMSAGKDTDLTSRIMGSRTAIAGAIDEYSRLGSVSQATMDGILSSAGVFGETADKVRQYTEGMIELSAATQKYDALLAPLNAHLKELQDKDQEIADNEKIAALQKNLGSTMYSEAQKEKMRREIQEIQLKRQIANTQKEKDAAVAAAKAKLDPAKAAIDATMKQNKLVEEQAKLMEQLAKAAERATKAAAGGAGAMPAPKIASIKPPAIGKAEGLDDVATPYQQLKDKILAPFKSIGAEFNRMTATWTPILNRVVEMVTRLGNAFMGFVKSSEVGAFIENLTGTLAQLAGIIFSGVQVAVDWIVNTGFPLLGQAVEFVNEHWAEFQAALIAIGAVLAGAAIAGAIAGIVAAIAALANPVTLIVAAIGVLAAAWAGNWGGIRDKLTEVWNAIRPALEQFGVWLGANIPIAMNALASFWTTTLEPAFQAIWNWLQVNIPAAVATITTVWSTVLFPAITAIWDFFNANLLPIFQALASLLTDVVSLAINIIADDFNNAVLPALKALWNFINVSILPIFKEIARVVKDVVGATLLWVIDNVFKPFQKALEDLMAGIQFIIGLIDDAIKGLAKLTGRATNAGVIPEGKQAGGPVEALSPYVVGERGPELFVPAVPGRIVPNMETSRILAAASNVTNIMNADNRRTSEAITNNTSRPFAVETTRLVEQVNTLRDTFERITQIQPVQMAVGRAAGGPVTPFQPYIVGERGPELFMPATAGMILPQTTSNVINNNNRNMTLNVYGAGNQENIISDFAMMQTWGAA